MTPAATVLASLLDAWEADAAVLERRGDLRGATLLRQCVAEARAAIAAGADELLTLGEAAQVSGFSAEHLRRLVATGALPNAGRRHAPRVRSGDLPRKSRAAVGQGSAGGYDPTADARALAGKLRAG